MECLNLTGEGLKLPQLFHLCYYYGLNKIGSCKSRSKRTSLTLSEKLCTHIKNKISQTIKCWLIHVVYDNIDNTASRMGITTCISFSHQALPICTFLTCFCCDNNSDSSDHALMKCVSFSCTRILIPCPSNIHTSFQENIDWCRVNLILVTKMGRSCCIWYQVWII